MLSGAILGPITGIYFLIALIGGMGNNALTPISGWMVEHVGPVLETAFDTALTVNSLSS